MGGVEVLLPRYCCAMGLELPEPGVMRRLVLCFQLTTGCHIVVSRIISRVWKILFDATPKGGTACS